MVDKKEVKKSDLDKLAYDVSEKIYNKFKGLVKSIVLIGSVAKGKPVKGSDIDLVILLDNVTLKLTSDYISWYRTSLAKIIDEMFPKREDQDKVHLTTLTLTSFWESLVNAEPAVINFVRYGIPLIDEMKMLPSLKAMLSWGKIRPSKEAVYNCLTRSPWHLGRARVKLLSAVEDIYWACVDAGHAILMHYNEVPPSPEHIPKLLTDVLVPKRIITPSEVKFVSDVIKLAKDINHGDTTDIKGIEIDRLRKQTEELTSKIKKIIK